MGMFGEGEPLLNESDAYQAPREQQNQLDDGRYYANLIRREGAGAYFFPRCGEIYNGEVYCDCQDSHPHKTISLADSNNFDRHTDTIRRKNPF